VSPVKYELGFYIAEGDILHSLVPVKTLQLPEGQTGNAWEPSKPMIYSVPPTRSVSHYYPLLSLFIVTAVKTSNLT
jgi:hypothetical protein